MKSHKLTFVLQHPMHAKLVLIDNGEENHVYISFSDPIPALPCLNSYYSSSAFQKVIAKVVNIIRKDSSPVELSVDISEHECAVSEAKFAN